MKCHFVYAVPVTRLRRNAFRTLQQCGLPLCWLKSRRHPDTHDWPRKSPFENTRNIFSRLAERMPTYLYALEEHIPCRFDPDDVFIGHPYFPALKGRKGTTELSATRSPKPRVFALISPLHCDISVCGNHINKAFLDAVDRLLPQADILFGIMGEYWWNRWPTSPYAHWMPKMVRLDMAIDVTCFPRVKTRFNAPGKRGFLYIGTNRIEKGTSLLSRLGEALRDYRWGWIGGGPEIEHIERLSTARPLTPDYMSEVARRFDIFVSPSIADPNPTTILESMAWGLPVACTPQSGYYETTFRRGIFHEDLERTVEVLQQLQHLDAEELRNMADQGRASVEREYTWDRFVDTLCRTIGLE